MGYADPDLRYTNAIIAAGSDSGDTATSYFHSGDEHSEGLRAAITRKRRSLFGGRPESMSSFTDLTAKKQIAAQPPTLTPASVQGVPYHTLPERPASNERRSTDPSDNRRSFFGGRFKLGRRDTVRSPRRELSPQRIEQPPMRPAHVRGLSAPADVLVEPKDQRHPSEDECKCTSVVTETRTDIAQVYRNHRKQSISPPFNFEHVTHTRKKHLPALETVDEKDLTKEFWAVSANQPAKRQLKGIQADDLRSKLEAMGVSRGAVSSRPSTPSGHDQIKTQARPALGEPRKSSSKEDITALPIAAKKSKREEFGSLLGLRTSTNVLQKPVPQKPSPDKKAAHESAMNALLGLPDKPSRSRSVRSNSGTSDKPMPVSLPERSPHKPAPKRESRDISQTRKPSLESRSSSNTKRDATLLGFKDRSMSDSSKTSTEKRDDVNALLGIRDSKRSSKVVDSAKHDEINALLGNRPSKKEFKPMQPPAPPRPRRSDESLPNLRREITPSAPSPALSAPDRPRRDSHDVQHLQNMGFGQLLYRANSAESRHSPSSPSSPVYANSPHLDERQRTSPREGDSEHFSELERSASMRAQQLRYRAKQPLPAVPNSANISPLQTVNEYGEMHSPLPTPVDSAISPKSPTSMHSAQRSVGTIRSAELTGPGMPDDETWEDEIDFLYKQQAEATNDFDWDNVSMTPQRLSARDPDKRLSLNIPTALAPPAMRLSKKLSEGSLRSSLYSPSPQPVQNIYERTFSGVARNSSPLSGWKEDRLTAARASPEVKVVDVDDQRSMHAYPAGALQQMHGYEGMAVGYLSDPESANSSSQHRKSNSYSSWESRPSVAKEQGRSSNNSENSVPELVHPIRRGRKEPITSIYQLDQQVQPQKQQTQHPMHEYAAFSRGPYGGYADEQSSVDHVSSRRSDLTVDQYYPRSQSRASTYDGRTDVRRHSRLSQNMLVNEQPGEEQAGWI